MHQVQKIYLHENKKQNNYGKFLCFLTYLDANNHDLNLHLSNTKMMSLHCARNFVI